MGKKNEKTFALNLNRLKNEVRIEKKFAEKTIPVGFLLFTLSHELIFDGAAALAAPLISSVVIAKTENIVKFKPMHRCRLLPHALHALLRMLLEHAGQPCPIAPGSFALDQSCACARLNFGLCDAATEKKDEALILTCSRAFAQPSPYLLVKWPPNVKRMTPKMYSVTTPSLVRTVG